jgi:hypothetical protein
MLLAAAGDVRTLGVVVFSAHSARVLLLAHVLWAFIATGLFFWDRQQAGPRLYTREHTFLSRLSCH